MQSMHLALPVGPFGWENNPLNERVFRDRIDALRVIMKTKSWSGIIVFGDVPEFGLLTYVSNFAPRLSAAFAFIPMTGEPAILSLDGSRMINAGCETTWIKDVSPVEDITVQFQKWLERLGGGALIGLACFDLMPAVLFDKISGLTGMSSGEDATALVGGLARRKSSAELAIIRTNCTILKDAATAAAKAFGGGADTAAAVIAGEKRARNAGAQDVRSLYSVDSGKSFRPYQGLDPAVCDPSIIYTAIRARGYWVDGFITLGNCAGAHQTAARVLANTIASIGVGRSVSDLPQAGDHPLLAGSLGCGIGVSVEEEPRLDKESQKFQAGDVISVKVGLSDGYADYGWASGIVSVGEEETDIYWQS